MTTSNSHGARRAAERSPGLWRGIFALSASIILFPHGVNARAFACPQPAVQTGSMTPKMPDQPHLDAKRQAAIQHLLAGQRYHAIALGDSIMTGWSNQVLDYALGGPVLNASFAGDLIENLLWRIDALDWSNQSPKYVLIIIGTNDLGWPACDIYWGIREVLRQLRMRLPAAREIVVSILPRGEDLMLQDQKIRDVNAVLKENAASGGYLFLDAHDAFSCDHRLPCPLFSDTVHPSPAGVQLLAEQVRELLSQNSQ